MAKFQYTVTGKGHFPFDMLRYDACWPARPECVMVLEFQPERPNMDARKVVLRSDQAPTRDRWSSFGWQVWDVEKNGRPVKG